ncbi:MAG: HAMP domain-containing histidine kinase, partial [bacterium]|nr:HAMP domain-containing histidine kinase [bacterium]
RAAIEEDVRLALWRLDSSVVPIMARENAYPFEAYRSFARASAQSVEFAGSPYDLRPSPLLAAPQSPVKLHFEADGYGDLSSPQSPQSEMRRRALRRALTDKDTLAKFEHLLKDFHSRFDLDVLNGLLADDETNEEQDGVDWSSLRLDTRQADAGVDDRELSVEVPAEQGKRQRATIEQQQVLNISEFEARASKVGQNMQIFTQQVEVPESESLIDLTAMRPMWLDGELLLVRRARTEVDSYLQGGWVDWSSFREELLASIADLFPDADLLPVELDERSKYGGAELAGRRLASLPVVLEPGAVTQGLGGGPSLTALLVGVAWLFLALAGVSVAALLHGSVSLSERRGAFVSAVTHELRTPLTSLRMYAEMLANDMVEDEGAKKEYLSTLQQQSERLSHLVENVLAYSRIERGLVGGERHALGIAELFERVRQPLVDLASQVGQELAFKIGDEAANATVRVDLSAIERILFNLVDNAGKYGLSDHVPGVVLSVEREQGVIQICVCDFGEGMPPEVRKRLFTPFSKSAAQAAESAPGIGLGLTISRRLARQMGGDLELETAVGKCGTSFVLRIPIANEVAPS